MIRKLILLVPPGILMAQAVWARPGHPTMAVWLLIYGAIVYGGILGWSARARKLSMGTVLMMAPMFVVAGLGLCGIAGLSLADLGAFAALPAAYGALIGWMARQIYEETPCNHGRWILRRFPDGAVARVCRTCLAVEYVLAGPNPAPSAIPGRVRASRIFVTPEN